MFRQKIPAIKVVTTDTLSCVCNMNLWFICYKILRFCCIYYVVFGYRLIPGPQFGHYLTRSELSVLCLLLCLPAFSIVVEDTNRPSLRQGPDNPIGVSLYELLWIHFVVVRHYQLRLYYTCNRAVHCILSDPIINHSSYAVCSCKQIA